MEILELKKKYSKEKRLKEETAHVLPLASIKR